MDRLDTQERYLERLLNDMSMEDLCEFFLDTMNRTSTNSQMKSSKRKWKALCPEVLN